jgi:hypothetical protein
MTRIAVSAFFLASLAMADDVSAGPDATANYLINEPASMMDIGIERLSRVVTIKNTFSDAAVDEHPGIGINYNRNANRIVINLLSGRHFESAAAFYAYARKRINLVRAYLWVDPDTGHTYPGNHGKSLAASLFMHKGYAEYGTPEGLAKNIDKLIVIKIRGVAATEHSSRSRGLITCQGNLVDTRVLCDR